MTRAPWRPAIGGLIVGLWAAPPTRGSDPRAELDLTANVRLIDTYFGRYGYAPTRTISRDDRGVRLRLPGSTAGVGQTGLYSYFALAGDFEVSAVYELLAVAPPQGGYGVTCGIALDAQGPGGSVAVARGHVPGQGSVYVVTRGQSGEEGVKYETTQYKSQAKVGRLALRREKAEVVCLVADGMKEDLRELCRVPFTDGTIRPIRVFADPGGSRTAVDARLSQLGVRAEEIAGGVTRHETGGGSVGWWVAGAAALVIAATAVVWFIRRRRRDS